MTKADMPKITIIDYGMGNLMSVASAFRFLGCLVRISDKKDAIEDADALVLPGVGAFGEAMKNLNKLELVDVLSKQVITDKKPFLGICLGMQLIATDSNEGGKHCGLGWVPGHVRRLKTGQGLRLPHVGWNDIQIMRSEQMFEGVKEDLNFYFVHSYHLECDDALISAVCDYGSRVTAAIRIENIFATQFHPEKSQSNGLWVLRNFINYTKARCANSMVPGYA